MKALQDQQRASLNLSTAEKAQTLTTEKLKIQKQQLTKATKAVALEELGLVSAYDKVVQKMNQAGKVVQNLNAKKLSGQKLNILEVNSLKRSEREFLKYSKAVKGADASINRFQRNVGNYPKALKAAASAARSLASAMGLMGGAFLIVNAIKNAFNRVREFDKSMQNLAGVLRTTRNELAPTEAEIIKVAGASIKTSREVANLAETLATLGKSPEQINKLLKPVNDLSIGLNATSEEAGEFLVQMLNAFGASESEAASYADTIATIRTSTTLDFQKMRDSFQYIVPISKILNKDLAYTGSVVGILADNSLKAESAGRLLATAQQRLSKSGKSLNDALEEINEARKRGVEGTELLSIATKLFGAQAGKVGIILANNTDLIEENAQAIRDNGGALDDLVNEQLKSLDAKLKILDSSWEELILTIENGEGAISKSFKESIQLLTTMIQRTTELEKAQSKVFQVTGKSKGWADYLKRINPLTSLIKTDYEELVELQEEFNRTNENIDANGIIILESMYDKLEKTIETNNDLSIEQEKIYQKQLVVVQEAIDKKKDERKSLEETAIALGFNEKELGKYADSISQYTNGDLQKFISSNEEAAKSIKKISEAQKRTKLKPLKIESEETKSNDNDLKKQIEILEKTKKLYADNSEEAKYLTKQIKFLTDALEFDIDNTSGIESLEDWSKNFEKQQKNIYEIQKKYSEKREELERELGENIKTIGFSLVDSLFQKELNRLDEQASINEEKANTALKFANGNAAAELQIQDQLAERQGEIEEERIKTEQKAFLLNQAFKAGEIAIDTIKSVAALKAQAAILLSNPVTAPLAALALGQIPLVIATGATAGAAIIAQSLPAFKDGVRGFEGGLAIVGDGGKSEVIRTPDGNSYKTPSTNTLVNLPKGSDVFSSEADFMKDLKRLTDINNIMFDSSLINTPNLAPSINISNQGATAQDFDRVLSKHLSNLQTNVLNIDENGFTRKIIKGNSATIQHNNRTSFKGFSV